jgi:segregation and condensation protein B
MDQREVPLEVLRLAEALVFASVEPVTWRQLGPLLPPHLDPDQVLRALQLHCADRGVVLVEQGGGWVFRTAPDLVALLRSALAETRKLPRGAMEVLVVIALHQPITRADIEAIRGVTLGQATMDLLLEAGLIAAHGRRQTPGSPTLWGTTPLFLAQFGLRSIRDIPGWHLTLPVPGGRDSETRAGKAAGRTISEAGAPADRETDASDLDP